MREPLPARRAARATRSAACSPRTCRAAHAAARRGLGHGRLCGARRRRGAGAGRRCKLIGEVAAGHPSTATVGPGEAARIFTGGVMPAGADTVVIQEITARDGDTRHRAEADRQGPQCARPGIDFTQGADAAAQGPPPQRPRPDAGRRHELSDVDRASPAEGGGARHRRRTGGAGRDARARRDRLFQRLCARRHGAREGAEVRDLGIAPRPASRTSPRRCAAPATGAPISWSPPAAPRSASTIWCSRRWPPKGSTCRSGGWRCGPGRPMMHGRLGAMQVLGVPGNPVSSYVCAFLFLVPLIRRLPAAPMSSTCRAGPARLRSAGQRRAGRLSAGDADAGPDGPVATPLPAQDSSLMAPLAKADCLLIRAPHAPAAAAGSPCVILKLGL